MNLFTGLVLIFVLFVFHVVIRRVRKLNDRVTLNGDIVAQKGARTSEWMAYTDHRIEQIHEKLGMLPTPEELGDVDPIELQERIDDEREESLTRASLADANESETLAALPDYGVDKDWRDTKEYKEMSHED